MKDLKYTVEFIRNPLEQHGYWKQTAHKWLATINGQEFVYYTGSAHRAYNPKYRGHHNGHSSDKWTKNDWDRFQYKKLTTNGFKAMLVNSIATEPSLNDVLYSLIMDSDALEYDFNEWCDNLGYDNDSIKARDIYQACQDNTLKLKKIVDLDETRKHFQDY